MTGLGRIRIVGCGALTGAGRGAQAFWDALCAARPLQQPRDLGDVRLSDARFVSIREPRRPQGDLTAAWAALACQDALEQAGPTRQRFESPRLALFCGSSLGGMSLFESQHRRRWDPSGLCGGGAPTTPSEPWRSLYDGPTKAVAHTLVPSAGAWTLNTACSSAANALGLARLWLERRRIDVAVVVGVDQLSPFVYTGFQCIGAIDPEFSTPFGAERHGLNLGEAAVALVLTRVEDAAPSDSPIDIIGFASSCDAHHLTRPDPSGAGLANAVAAALKDAGVGPRDIGLVSAHATGTPFNDSMEAAAFAACFGDRVPPIHGAKPIVGHTLGAAGLVDALAVQLMLQHKKLPLTFLRGAEDPALAAHPARQPHDIEAKTIALSTSSGFGGSNAALVMCRGVA